MKAELSELEWFDQPNDLPLYRHDGIHFFSGSGLHYFNYLMTRAANRSIANARCRRSTARASTAGQQEPAAYLATSCTCGATAELASRSPWNHWPSAPSLPNQTAQLRPAASKLAARRGFGNYDFVTR